MTTSAAKAFFVSNFFFFITCDSTLSRPITSCVAVIAFVYVFINTGDSVGINSSESISCEV